MTIATYEGIVEKGHIRVQGWVHLPDNTRVYVIVPDMKQKKTAQVLSPRLVCRDQAADFTLEVSEENPHAG
jgi:hypothetical protein